MGQTAAKEQVDQFKKSVPELQDLIPELKDVTLKGVVPLNDELGRGAYGSVFSVKHGDVVCAANSGVAKVGNGWAQAQPIMSSAQPIFMSIVQPIYAPFHVKIYNK